MRIQFESKLKGAACESMFYLIGVAHRVQSKARGSDDTEEQKAYRACLTAAIKRIEPAVVAEEFSNDALRKANKSDRAEHESITREIASALGTAHRFCDPEQEAREKMGYVQDSGLRKPRFGQLQLTS